MGETRRGIPKPETPTLDRLQAPHIGGWTRKIAARDEDGVETYEPCRLVDHSNLIGEFLDWLEGQGVRLATWGHNTYSDPVERIELPESERGEKPDGVSKYDWLHQVVRWEDREDAADVLLPLGKGPDKLLHEYFDIDANEEEREKRALLEWIRANR